MKNLIYTITLIIFSFVSSQAQNDCSVYYPFIEGSVSEITHYNKRGKVASVEEHTISKISRDEGGNEVASITSIIKDKKGKKISDAAFNMTCSGDKIQMDIESMLNPDLYKQFKDIKVTISGTGVELPNHLETGETLPNANMVINMDMGGIQMNMEVIMKNRKVEGMENVTTDAGTFDCVVISYTTSIEMGMTRETNSKQWIAKGVGLVKAEDYNKRGKIMSSSLLTSFSK